MRNCAQKACFTIAILTLSCSMLFSFTKGNFQGRMCWTCHILLSPYSDNQDLDPWNRIILSLVYFQTCKYIHFIFCIFYFCSSIFISIFIPPLPPPHPPLPPTLNPAPPLALSMGPLYMFFDGHFIFVELYFIDYAITVVPIFLPLPASTQHLPLPQAITTTMFMSMGDEYKFFRYSISYTVLYIPMAILQLPICTS